MNRLWKAFCYSLSGIYAAWKGEAAFRQELMWAVVMIPSAVFLAPDKISLLMMIGSVLMVLTVELVNTAIESAVDRVSGDIHPLAKKAKDAASAAVLFAIGNTILVWAVVLLG